MTILFLGLNVLNGKTILCVPSRLQFGIDFLWLQIQ